MFRRVARQLGSGLIPLFADNAPYRGDFQNWYTLLRPDAIAQRLQQVSRDVVQVPQGSLYPALHRLENRGLLAADWNETETGREAKFYRLTRQGRVQLDAETASWGRLTEAVGLILNMGEAE